MPTYPFKNTDTGEEYELFMSMAERDRYLKRNKNVVQLLSSVTIGDPVLMGITKPPSSFTDNIKRMQAAIPGNNIKSKYNWGY